MLICVIFAAPLSYADSVIVRGKPLEDIQIVGFSEGMIEYSTAIGDFDHFSIRDIDSIAIDSVDRAEMFNAAETFVARNDPRKSLEAYEKAQLSARGFWSELVRARFVQAADDAHSFEKAVRAWMKIAHRDEVTASWLLPVNLPDQPSHATRRVIKKLERAIERSATLTERALLETIRFSTLHAMDDVSARVLAAPLMNMIIKTRIFAPRTVAVFVAAGDLLIENGEFAHVTQQVEKTVTEVQHELLPEILLLKSRALLASASNQEDYLSAALPAMRVVIHFPNHPLVGEGLILAAQAHQASGRSSQAKRLLEACIATEQSSSKTRNKAANLLKRLTMAPNQARHEMS